MVHRECLVRPHRAQRRKERCFRGSGWAALSGSTITTWQDTPNSTAGIRNIARVPGYQVDMHVHSRLTACLSNIYANVVSVGRMPTLNDLLRLVEQSEHRRLLLRTHVEEACDMPLWDSEDVATAERVIVVTDVRQCVLDDDVVWSAQLTGRVIGGQDSRCLTFTARGARRPCARPG